MCPGCSCWIILKVKIIKHTIYKTRNPGVQTKWISGFFIELFLNVTILIYIKLIFEIYRKLFEKSSQ
jgi:hypothetical protein